MQPFLFVYILFGVLVVAFLLKWPSCRHEQQRRKARRIHSRLLSGELSGGAAMAYLRKIDPYVFEELVLDGFESNGFKVTRNRRYSGDGGIDGNVRFEGEDYLVQCKRYRAYIQAKHVEDFAELCTRRGLDGFFVHTGKTGQGAKDARCGCVEVVSGDRLLGLLSSKKNPSVVIKQSNL